MEGLLSTFIINMMDRAMRERKMFLGDANILQWKELSTMVYFILSVVDKACVEF